MATEFTFSGTATSAPTLSTTTFSETRVKIADMLSWGRTAGNWGTVKTARLGEILNEGYQQFIFPPILPGETNAHRWSFLRPVTTLTTEDGEDAYDLPEAFGALVGDFTFAAGDNVQHAIERVSEVQIRKYQGQIDGSTTGKPQYCAIRPKDVDMNAVQVREVVFWPTPDDELVLSYQYDARLPDWSTADEYPLGGQEHALTLLQSCRDIAARTMDDEARLDKEHARFLERLGASIEQDRKHAPTTLGHNRGGTGRTLLRHGTEFTASLRQNF